MKKYMITTVILFLGILLGCSKNDDGPQKPSIIDKSANLKATGESANDILSNTTYDKLHLEIGYVEGFKPTSETMTNFLTFIKQHTFKQNIEIVYKQLPSPQKETLKLDEIDDLEKENRTAYNSENTLAIYIYFADAASDDDNEDEDLVTLGAVYRNTSMVIYEATVRKLAGRSTLISNTDVETATLNHEFGHLLGLVNLGTPMVNAHEDEDAVNHCNVDGCLMLGELQFGSQQNKNSNLTGKIIIDSELQAGCMLNGKSVLKMLERKTSKGLIDLPGLDAACMADLKANGGK